VFVELRKETRRRKEERGGGVLYLASRWWRITSSSHKREDSNEREEELGKRKGAEKHEFILAFYAYDSFIFLVFASWGWGECLRERERE
jgi:hypothetical protein